VHYIIKKLQVQKDVNFLTLEKVHNNVAGRLRICATYNHLLIQHNNLDKEHFNRESLQQVTTFPKISLTLMQIQNK